MIVEDQNQGDAKINQIITPATSTESQYNYT